MAPKKAAALDRAVLAALAAEASVLFLLDFLWKSGIKIHKSVIRHYLKGKNTWLPDAVFPLTEGSVDLMVLVFDSMVDDRWLTSGKGRNRGDEETKPTTEGVSGFLLPTGLAKRAAHKIAWRSEVSKGPNTNCMWR